MRLKPLVILGVVALALASPAASAADAPGFNDLDRNNDGALSRSEAGGNAPLAARFAEVDTDRDGKLSRAEYLKTMAKKDFTNLRERAAELIKPDKSDSSSAASGGTSKKP